MILAKYVGKVTAIAMVVTTFLLEMLQLTFSFIAELSKLTDQYTVFKALKFVGWEAIEQVYNVLPVSVLIGAVVGLGSLAANSELVVMRASGVSIWRIVRWVLIPTLGFGILALVLNQWIMPYSIQKALSVKYADGGVSRVKEVHGYWLRQGNDVVFIEYANATGDIKNILTLEFDQSLRLNKQSFATEGKYQNDKNWILTNNKQINLLADGSASMLSTDVDTKVLNLNPNYIHMMTQQPDILKLSDLYRYIQYLKRVATVPAAYQLAFWQKALTPFFLMSAVMLACTFVFGSLRQQTMGLRIVVALVVGMSIKYFQELFGYIGLISTVPVIYFVTIPIIVVFLISLYFLRKIG